MSSNLLYLHTIYFLANNLVVFKMFCDALKLYMDMLQTFLSELYVYLVDQMHVALSKFLSLEDKTPVPKPLTDSAQLKHFAREAEVNEVV